MESQTRRLALPNRVRHPTDCLFASGCSPPHFAVTQLPSATALWHTPTGTFTLLMNCPRGRTSPEARASESKVPKPELGNQRKMTFALRHASRQQLLIADKQKRHPLGIVFFAFIAISGINGFVELGVGFD